MNIVRCAALAATLACAASPVLAGEHSFTLHNNLTRPITNVSVRGGEVSGFSGIAPGERVTFTVILPGSDCVAVVRASVAGARREGRVNVCDKGGYVLTPAASGPKFLPLSQVMLAQ